MIRSRKLVVTFSLEEELCNYLKREFVDATIHKLTMHES